MVQCITNQLLKLARAICSFHYHETVVVIYWLQQILYDEFECIKIIHEGGKQVLGAVLCYHVRVLILASLILK